AKLRAPRADREPPAGARGDESTAGPGRGGRRRSPQALRPGGLALADHALALEVPAQDVRRGVDHRVEEDDLNAVLLADLAFPLRQPPAPVGALREVAR